MKVKFIVLAMQKCGNHGIIHWIGKQSKETLLHCNNKYESVWNNLDIDKIPIKVGENNNYVVEDDDLINYIFNLEDFDFRYFKDLITKKVFKDNPLILIFGRDPFNWLASCYNDKFATPPKTRYTELLRSWQPAFMPKLKFSSRLSIYKQHMFEVLGKTNYLKGYDFVFINYNKWFESEKYRNFLSDKLDLNKGSEGMDWNENGLFLYSNFRNYNTPKSKNDVLARYKIFKNDEEFRKLCNDDELIYISDKLFNFIPKW